MLQQTTVATVLKKYPPFIERFPNFQTLHEASLDEVLLFWSGLGYYARARRLKELASLFKDQLPSTYNELIQYPGIGPYTAQALLSLYYQEKIFALDTNLKRVLSRINLHEYPSLYPSRELNEAFMDLGRTYCTARFPKCEECFLKTTCPSAFKTATPPVKKDKQELNLLRFYFFDEQKRLFLYKRASKAWLQDQFEVPTFSLEPISQYPLFTQKIDLHKFFKFKTTITKYTINNFIILNKIDHKGEFLNIENIPLSSATKKGLELILQKTSY